MSNLAAEVWTWYAITWVVVISRWTSQYLLRGSFKKLQPDDFLMVFVMLCDTALIVGINIISHTNSNLIHPDDPPPLELDDIAERAYGSKVVMVVEQMQCLVIWTVKVCFLILYGRFTSSLKNHIVVKMVAAYVALTFVTMEVLYLGVWCRPFSQYFAVPPDNLQCSAATNHLITNAVFNITSDVMIISIPLPIFIQSQLPRKRKAVLCLVFALGFFTILCAILNKYYSFTQPFGSDWTFWYIRESSTAIIVGNLPLTWPLIRQLFNVKSFGGESTANKYGRSTTPHYRRSVAVRHPDGIIAREDASVLEPSASEERIIKSMPLKIYRQDEVTVNSHPLPMGRDDYGLHGPVPGGGLASTVNTTASVGQGFEMGRSRYEV